MADVSEKAENSFWMALHLASYKAKCALKKTFADAGVDITPEEFGFLYLVPKGGAQLGDLTKRALKDKTNITRMVDRLVKKGWIERCEDPENRRQKIVCMTKSGEKVRKDLLKAVDKISMEAAKGLDQKTQDTMRDSLKTVIGNLSDF